MNKKFSTLMVSLLLASAFVGTADAQIQKSDAAYVRLTNNAYTSDPASTWTAENSGWELSVVDGVVVDAQTANNAVTKANMWKVEEMVIGGTTKGYRFTNGDGVVLKINKATHKQPASTDDANAEYVEWFTIADGTVGGTDFSTITYSVGNATYYLSQNLQNGVLVIEGMNTFGANQYALGFTNTDIEPTAMGADALNAKGSGSDFQLAAKNNPKLEKDLTLVANPLTTKAIHAINNAGTVYFRVSGSWDGERFTGNDDDAKAAAKAFAASEFIAVDTLAYSTGINDLGVGYKYTVVKGSEMIGADGNTRDPKRKRNIENAQFQVISDVNLAYVKVVSPYAKYPAVGSTGAASHTSAGAKKVTVYNFNGVNYLGTGDGKRTYLTFGAGSSADLTALAGKMVTVDFVGTGGNAMVGKVLGANGWEKAANVDQTKPEGRFYVKVDGNNLKFVNLENRSEYPFKGTIYDKGNNVYANANADWYGGDTLKITAVTRAAQTDGYLNFDKDALADKAFKISLYTKALGKGYWVAPVQTSGVVSFSTDDADATEWSLVKAQKASSEDYANSDSIIQKLDYNVWNATKKAYEAKSDSTVSFAYAIKESVSGKYLRWNWDKHAYDLSATPNYFVFKEKDGHIVIIDADRGGDYPAQWNGVKMIGAASTNSLATINGVYSIVENDLFDINEISAMRYRNLGELALDTVKIFRADNERIMLYEKNEATVIKDSINFLGIEHIADVEGMKAAMFVDTAYVSNTVAPKYMFAVGSPVITYKKVACSDPTHPAHETDEIESITGRYLVNLVDSANAYADYSKNPYIHKYEGANCARLGFVDATHKGNKMTIANTKKEIDLSKDELQYCTFALRYVDREAGSFKLQTKGGFVKYMNGVAAVTSEGNADVFNLSKTSEAPTANEAIEASEVVVVAGKGVVTVQGAAGKVVTVANILGQTIANQVAASDNVTIAVPAGIVVVAVDGEATKVVVK